MTAPHSRNFPGLGSSAGPATGRARRRGVRTTGIALIALSLVLGACGSGEVAVDTGVRVVSPQQATSLLAADPAPVLIDVRTPAEFAEAHLAGAELVDYNAADFRDRIGDYPRDASYVIYCRSGNRSEGARRIMSELGFVDVADIDGGILAWTQAGLPVTA